MPKLLIVEDNELNRDMLSRRLIRRGYDVVLAVDGAQGVAMAGTERPDLILLDMSLPVLVVVGFVAGFLRNFATDVEMIWSFSPFVDLSLYRWIRKVVPRPKILSTSGQASAV